MNDEKPSKPGGSADEKRADPQLRAAVEITVRLGVIALLVGWCLLIIAPFISIVAWAVIIAIGAATPYEKLCGWLGGRHGLAAPLFVVLMLMVLIAPAVALSGSLVTGAERFAAAVSSGELHLPAPPAGVAEIPVVGERLHASWEMAYENLGEALGHLRPQLEAVSRWLLQAAGSAGIGLLSLIASLLLAGVMLASADRREAAVFKFMSRLAGPERGAGLAETANGTVRSVVQGILGVALIQSVLAGAGFLLAGIPAAGLWAFLVLIAAVIQIPVALVMIPPVLIGFSLASMPIAVALAIWSLFVSLVDNVLKPILFGRGVQVPTLVIFLGSIGGMLTMGILGLFLGAVVLALGYELFKAWLDAPETDAASATARTQ